MMGWLFEDTVTAVKWWQPGGLGQCSLEGGILLSQSPMCGMVSPIPGSGSRGVPLFTPSDSV